MGFAELRESSQFEASGAQGLVWRHATAAVVLREHDEVRFEFLIEVAIEAAGPEERSNSRSHLFERCQHGGTPISHSCGLYRGVRSEERRVGKECIGRVGGTGESEE